MTTKQTESISTTRALKLALEALEAAPTSYRAHAVQAAIREALTQSRSDEEQPAQRTWIGLTDEEMNAALDYWSEDERSAYGGAHAADGEYVSMIDTWRYIEAKLKEKNGF